VRHSSDRDSVGSSEPHLGHVMAALPHLRSLSVFADVRCTGLWPEVLSAVATMTALTHLRLDASQAGLQDGLLLATSLWRLHRLQWLRARKLLLGPGSREVAAAVQRLGALTHLQVVSKTVGSRVQLWPDERGQLAWVPM
jgi:hypothetical protein